MVGHGTIIRRFETDVWEDMEHAQEPIIPELEFEMEDDIATSNESAPSVMS